MRRTPLFSVRQRSSASSGRASSQCGRPAGLRGTAWRTSKIQISKQRRDFGTKKKNFDATWWFVWKFSSTLALSFCAIIITSFVAFAFAALLLIAKGIFTGKLIFSDQNINFCSCAQKIPFRIRSGLGKSWSHHSRPFCPCLCLYLDAKFWV